MRLNIVYKVVYPVNGWFYSSNMMHHNWNNKIDDIFHLQYEVGKVTKPVIGKIFIFKTEDDARNYASQMERPMKIMKGVAVNVTKAAFRNVLSMTYHGKESSLKAFWQGDLSKNIVTGNGGWETPEDTYLCDSFRPLEVL